MLPQQLHEVSIVSLLQEDVFAIVAAVVDVIKASVCERQAIGRHAPILSPYK